MRTTGVYTPDEMFYELEATRGGSGGAPGVSPRDHSASSALGDSGNLASVASAPINGGVWTVVNSDGIGFRFDAQAHQYIELSTGAVFPHITWLLEAGGLVDGKQFYTQESRDRGHAVHRLTADYDLGAIEDVAGCTSRYKGWLQAHVACMQLLRPTILHVEHPLVHPGWRFGGRLDRVVRLHGRRGTFELKSGAPEKAHRVQTALQAILDSMEAGIPPDVLGRWAAYYRENGKFTVEEFTDRRDFDVAYRLLKEFAS